MALIIANIVIYIPVLVLGVLASRDYASTLRSYVFGVFY